jgi:hypothetical protein
MTPWAAHRQQKHFDIKKFLAEHILGVVTRWRDLASMPNSTAMLAADTAKALARSLLDLYDDHDGAHCAEVFHAWELLKERMADAGLSDVELRGDRRRIA